MMLRRRATRRRLLTLMPTDSIEDKQPMKTFENLCQCLASILVLVLLNGCAGFAGPEPLPDQNIRLTHQGASPSTRLSVLRSEARWYAYVYCQKQRKNIRVLAFEDAAGPFFIGNFPQTDIVFSCTE